LEVFTLLPRRRGVEEGLAGCPQLLIHVCLGHPDA
jgi:hypothetical protein